MCDDVVMYSDGSPHLCFVITHKNTRKLLAQSRIHLYLSVCCVRVLCERVSV